MKVGNGAKEACYKAGEMYGAEGHRTSAHQPCCFAITGGELQCPYCAAGLDRMWRGYLPVWDRDWTLRYALIGADHVATTDAIPHRAQMILIRAKNPISPLVAREEMCLTRALPDASPWNTPIDMELICMVLWKVPDLTRWIMARRAKDARENPKPAPLKSDGKPYTPPLQQAARKWTADAMPTGPIPVEQVIENAGKSIKAKLNGKHGT
jgi:hypothetical protein